ncbi:LysR family transcriptional regulator [Paenibacillus sedimenti]|uniref:LysR family transcriptional regulator n=1 Tax=Paenibacillus sedimenti TaxID=2770274 RepID=A0A926KWG9_9BACL|nr:LysR family transcriptional regulator [Paenibacillus sedimenti]MBD0383210.1 LysR family transcriptional regulator [Paenibacillus sedimenti]
MDTRKLEYFVEVVRAGSFTRAAERLHVAQPAISKSIQKLEDELQLILFDRSEKSVTLTPEGKVLLGHAQSILGSIEEARKEMEELRGLERGEIRIGLPSMYGSFYFPQIIKEFKKKYPSLLISVVEEGTLQVRKLIERKEVDLGIIDFDHAGPEIEVIPLLTEEMVACFPIGHPLAGRKSIPLQEMIHEPLILFKEGYFQRNLIMETSQTANIVPNITFSTNQLSLIRSLVAEGIGVTLFLRVVADSDPQLRSVSLNPPVFLHLGVGRSRNTYLSKASQIFLEFLKDRISHGFSTSASATLTTKSIPYGYPDA